MGRIVDDDGHVFRFNFCPISPLPAICFLARFFFGTGGVLCFFSFDLYAP